MKLLLTIFTIVVLVVGCKPKLEPKLESLAPVTIPKDSSTLYFVSKSSNTDPSNNKLNSFGNRWYSEMLFALREPILSNYPNERQVYRFTWLRTRHHPISIRVESVNGLIQLTLKETSGMGGYEPGMLMTDSAFLLSSADWKELLNRLKTANYWQLPTEKTDFGKDGAEWIVEGKNQGNYHVVSRWLPGNEQTSEYTQLCLYFLELARVTIPQNQLY